MCILIHLDFHKDVLLRHEAYFVDYGYQYEMGIRLSFLLFDIVIYKKDKKKNAK